MNENYIPNLFRQNLTGETPLIGCWSSLVSPITAEILGLAGFDWIMFDAEHAPNDVHSLMLQLMALKGSGSMPVVRPAQNDPVIIKRLLDIGFYNFLIPMIESRAEAIKAVAATRYPPQGMRGVAVSQRSNGFGTVANYQQIINDNISVLVQIESKQGVENIEEILAVEGVDGVFIGPSDLSASLGYLGQPGHPHVRETIDYIIGMANKYGKPLGTIAFEESEIRGYINKGFKFIAVGSDQGIFRKETQKLCQHYRNG
ncbi:2-dehydro-3-deoxyglucarate aldolase [Sodalis sp. RH21]|uniref:2-dehydro-3-deoxyglucarate aldolase n=1 Tax=unclassified Sodalis (in: enterobacteria) TaxID=2636512 RepID=UPI0039B3CA7F